MFARIVAVLAIALVAAPAATAAKPSNLHGFLLKSNESVSPHFFARTPSFAWSRVAGAARYELQLSSSKNFSDNAIVWESSKLSVPLATVPVTLPWVTGHNGYSWFARVRAFVGSKPTSWSPKYGFDLRSPGAPQSLSSGANTRPGMIRWTPVEGATAYQVSFLFNSEEGERKIIKTATTAADLREYYTFHNDPLVFDNDQGAPGAVYWRVRAVREVTGRADNDFPVVSKGPWSSENETIEPGLTTGAVDLQGAVSRSGSSTIVTGATGGPDPHELMPGFWWNGDDNRAACPPTAQPSGVDCPLFHVYVYSDDDCVNLVHASDLVGSPAYVPRLTGVLDLPSTPDKLSDAAGLFLDDKDVGESEGKVFDAGGDEVYAAGTDPLLPSDPNPVPEGKEPDRRTSLWDTDHSSSRYWWTVVAAIPHVDAENDLVEYHDVAFSEDRCQAGERMAFAKSGAVVVERVSGVPYASGLTSSGSVKPAKSAKPSFFGRVVVAWKPAPGVKKYEIQWSKKKNPWNRAGKKTTAGTAAELNLKSGTWYYRVRGIDTAIPGRQQGMTWSDPQYVRILPRTFVVS
jgi:hypothetical protein